jgi:hypothetical protein
MMMKIKIIAPMTEIVIAENKRWNNTYRHFICISHGRNECGKEFRYPFLTQAGSHYQCEFEHTLGNVQ